MFIFNLNMIVIHSNNAAIFQQIQEWDEVCCDVSLPVVWWFVLYVREKSRQLTGRSVRRPGFRLYRLVSPPQPVLLLLLLVLDEDSTAQLYSDTVHRQPGRPVQSAPATDTQTLTLQLVNPSCWTIHVCSARHWTSFTVHTSSPIRLK